MAIVAGSMLGVGIFLNPRIVAEQFQSPIAFMSMWLLGGLIALAGAASYAQLGAMFPKAGGDYVYLREAFGRTVSAAGGWILVVAVFPGSLATMAVALGQYQMPVLFDGYDASAIALGIPCYAWVALGLVALLTLMNAAGAYVSGTAQIWMTMVPVTVFGVVALFALATNGAGMATDTVPFEAGTSWFKRFTVSYMAVYFAYSGWNAVGYVGGEVSDPKRNIPFSLVGGTLLVTALYLVMCGAFLSVLGMEGLRAAGEAGSLTAASLFGDAARIPIALLIAFAIIGSLNATVLGGARIAFAMGQDGTLPSTLGTVWNRTRTPVHALMVQAAISCILVVSGTFEQLLAMTSLAMLVLGILTVSALFVVRTRAATLGASPGASLGVLGRFGYPVLPAIYLVFAVFVVAGSVWEGLRSVGSGHVDQEFVFAVVGLAVFAAVCAVYAALGAARSRMRVRG